MIRRERGSSRGIFIAVAAILSIGIAGWATGYFRPAPPRHVSDVPESETRTPPPEFPPVRTEEERIDRLITMLLTADTDDAGWARGRLASAGPAARARVAATARDLIQSNTAFVQHAFDVFVADPQPEDAALALDGLRSEDPGVVVRACRLLGVLGTRAPAEAVPALAVAVLRAHPIPIEACAALARIGGSEAEVALIGVASSSASDPTSRQQALVTLGNFRGEAGRAALVASLASAPDRPSWIAAAHGLVGRRDPAPIAQLRQDFAQRRDEQALTLLAWGADDVALREIETRLFEPLSDEVRRLGAIALLEVYPADVRRRLGRRVALEAKEDDLRVEGWDLYVKAAGDDAVTELREILATKADGAQAIRDRKVAALVAGRLRREDLGAACVHAAADSRNDEETRILLLRAAAMSGDLRCAEPLVRAIAGDPSGFTAPQPLSASIAVVFPGAPEAFRRHAGPFVRKALAGDYGELGPRARFDLIGLTAVCCGPEAAPVVESYLTHEERHYRELASSVLPEIAGPDTERALRSAWWKRQDDYTRIQIHTALERLTLARKIP